MRPELKLLRNLHDAHDQFEASEFVSTVLRSEIRQLRHFAQHGTFHEYSRKNGYPIPKDVVEGSSYLRRPGIEKQLSESIFRGRNVILVGCEGSGKSTLVHYVLGTTQNLSIESAIYIDASDVEGSTDQDSEIAILRKLANSINRISRTAIGVKFEEWIERCKNDVFLQSIVSLSTPRGLVEAFIVFLRTRPEVDKTYIVLDNLDSLSINANKILFSTLNRINETVNAACVRLDVKDQKNIKYIICCRTPTYHHVSGPALGLFFWTFHMMRYRSKTISLKRQAYSH